MSVARTSVSTSKTLDGTIQKKSEGNFEVNLERIDYWTGVGARTTETVDSILKKARKKGLVKTVSSAPNADDELKVKKVADLPKEELDAPQAEEAPAPAAVTTTETDESKVAAAHEEDEKKEA